MRNHEKFIEMPLYDKWIAYGKIQHLYSTSPTAFEKINLLIQAADEMDYFSDIKFMPDAEKSTEGL